MPRIFQNFAHKSRKRLYVGGSGTGKTTKCIRDMLAEYQAGKYEYTFVFDHEGQFAARIPAFPATSPELCLRAISKGSVCYDPSEMFPGDWCAGFNWFCEWVWNFSAHVPGTKLLVADELQDYLPHNPSLYSAHAFSKICGAGRRRGIDVFGIAPMLKNLNPAFRGQITEIFAFQNTDATAADDLATLGIAPEKLMALHEGQFIHWQKSAPLEFGEIDLAA